MLFSIRNSISDAAEQVSHSYDSMDEMVDFDQQTKTNEQLIAIGETLKAGMHDIYLRQRESERILRDQLEQLRQELERTRYEMKEERARLIHELEVQQKESREQYLVVQEKLNELLAAKAQQSKGKDNE
jgi:DNA anti-recombination protein RmuC